MDRNDELQKILTNTHAMLVENATLVDQLNETVVKKVTQEGGQKRINFVKDEGKQEAEKGYMELY